MKTQNIVTYDLADFGAREYAQAADLLKALSEGNYRYDAEVSDGIRLGFNRNSGRVWLEDEDYNCFMLEDGRLEPFLSTPYNGVEGFLQDLVDKYDSLCDQDKEFVRFSARYLGYANEEGLKKLGMEGK